MPTPLEQKIVQALRHYIAQHGQAPTLQALGKRVGIHSKGTVHRYVNSLIDQGLLTRDPHKGWRSISLTQSSTGDLHTLPLLGRIAAGKPIEAIPDNHQLNLMTLFEGEGRYALKVQGDSMMDAGILNDDWVVILSTAQAAQGEIIVALIDNEEVTLKRLGARNKEEVTLTPENSTLQPTCYSAERVQIQGVLIGQIRHYPR
ncbi:MAG: transcriptional repressor LexA [Gammaproteobacteria bacterium]|nr:transcriptional repressor LexA [Gammaproteobacteria bacterium]MCF6230716.1 transcriptional repressor LexA [Gammaproteobacteria bacterium]